LYPLASDPGDATEHAHGYEEPACPIIYDAVELYFTASVLTVLT